MIDMQATAVWCQPCTCQAPLNPRHPLHAICVSMQVFPGLLKARDHIAFARMLWNDQLEVLVVRPVVSALAKS